MSCCSGLVYYLTCAWTACQGRPCMRTFILPFTCCQSSCFLQVSRLDPVAKIDAQLVQSLAPIPAFPSPLFRDIHHGQIQNLEQGIIGWENSSLLCHFPKLPVEVLDGIRCVNDLADF